MHTGILLEFGVLKANADTGRQVKMNKGPFDVKTKFNGKIRTKPMLSKKT